MHKILYFSRELLKYIGSHFKQRSFLNLALILVLIWGAIFFIFAWVPYKQTERQFKLLEKQITETRNGLLEFKNSLNTINQGVAAENIDEATANLYYLTKAISKTTKSLEGLGAANTQRQTLIDQLPAMIFYPGFTKKTKLDLQQISILGNEQLGELTRVAKEQSETNRALLNLMVFDPRSYFEKKFSDYDGKELTKKLNSLNEAIGESDLTISRFQSQNKRTKEILALVKSQHEKVIAILDKVAVGDLNNAETIKNNMASELDVFRNKLNGINSNLLKVKLPKEHLVLIDEALNHYNSLLQKVQSLQEKYF